jgi:hypothetical protein
MLMEPIMEAALVKEFAAAKQFPVSMLMYSIYKMLLIPI